MFYVQIRVSVHLYHILCHCYVCLVHSFLPSECSRLRCARVCTLLLESTLCLLHCSKFIVRWMPDASHQSHLEISIVLH